MTASAWQWRASAGGDRPSLVTANLERGGRAASFAEVFAAWSDDVGFRKAWACWLADIPIASYCWEMPPLTTATLGRPFQCVFVDSPALAVPLADPSPFADYLPHGPAEQDAVVFANLGGDAMLVAPTPQLERSCYSHLARFLREAPPRQVAAIWGEVAAAIGPRLGDAPIWLSTAGLGVAWLHVRIDSIPKYYRHRPYAHAGFWAER